MLKNLVFVQKRNTDLLIKRFLVKYKWNFVKLYPKSKGRTRGDSPYIPPTKQGKRTLFNKIYKQTAPKKSKKVTKAQKDVIYTEIFKSTDDVNKDIIRIRTIIEDKKIFGRFRITVLRDGKVLNLDRIKEKTRNGKTIIDYVYNVRKNAALIWWNTNQKYYDWLINSNTPVLQDDDKIVFMKNTRISRKLIEQSFASAGRYEHCVCSPIIELYDDKLIKLHETRKNMKVQSYERLFNNYIKKRSIANKWKTKYINGIPESKMLNFAKEIKMSIQLQTVLGDNFNSYSVPNVSYNIKFRNSRINHVEYVSGKPVCNYIDVKEMSELTTNLDNDKKVYFYRKNGPQITYVNYIDKEYKLNLSEYTEVSNTFENTIFKDDDLKIDAIKEPNKTSYLQDGMHIPGVTYYKEKEYFSNCFNNVYIPKHKNNTKSKDLIKSYFSNDMAGYFDTVKTFENYAKKLFLHKGILNIKHIDMIMAYTQFLNNKYYLKFPARLSDLRKLPIMPLIDAINLVKHNVGFYTIVDLDFSKCPINTKNHLVKLGIIDGVYASPFIWFLYDIGVKFDVTEGCWGCTTFEFEFTKQMLDKIDNIQNYARWSGKQGNINTQSSMFIKCYDDASAALIKSQYPNDDVIYWKGMTDICINNNNKTAYHRIHLLGYIAAYESIYVMMQLLLIPFNQVVKVVADGIYYEDTKPFKFMPLMIPKESTLSRQISRRERYLPTHITHTQIEANFKPNHLLSFKNGAGGSGKSRDVLTDKGNCNMLFLTTAHALANDKRQEYNIKADVIANFIIPRPYIKKIYYDIIFWDEFQLATNNQFQLARKQNPYTKFICAGDYNFKTGKPYQTHNTDDPIDISIFKNITTNYKLWRYIKKVDPIKDIIDFNIIMKLISTKNKTVNDIDSITNLLISNVKLLTNKECNIYDPITEVALNIRKLMDNDVKVSKLTNYLLKVIEPSHKINDKQLKNMYNKKDTILVSRSKCSGCKKFECKHPFKKSGNSSQFYNRLLYKKNSINKYMYLKKQKIDDSIVFNGTIIFNKIKPRISRLAYAYTIHKATGTTITQGNKLFIDTKNLYDYTLVYSAISRARSIDQIYLLV